MMILIFSNVCNTSKFSQKCDDSLNLDCVSSAIRPGMDGQKKKKNQWLVSLFSSFSPSSNMQHFQNISLFPYVGFSIQICHFHTRVAAQAQILI